jgi:tryptophanyl-tRNA synthetase
VMIIPGVNGDKMSKSYGNTIDIFAPDNELKKTIKSIISDSKTLEEPKDPATDTTFKLYSLLASEEETAAMRQNYLNGNYGYGHAKQALFELIVRKFARERELFNYYMNNLPEIDARLKTGADKARAIGAKTLNRVREKLGLRPR